MAKIKHTKNSLKAQRDALRRFSRFLPTLQLKKQQLQLEVRKMESLLEQQEAALTQLQDQLSPWISMFAEPFDFLEHVKIATLEYSDGNIAGVHVPVLERLEFEDLVPNLMETRAWVDDGMAMLKKTTQATLERDTLREQLHRIKDELRITNQRVNLFEKVKIPECKENIRIIRVFLGDQQTAGVIRAKIAKSKSKAEEVGA